VLPELLSVIGGQDDHSTLVQTPFPEARKEAFEIVIEVASSSAVEVVDQLRLYTRNFSPFFVGSQQVLGRTVALLVAETIFWNLRQILSIRFGRIVGEGGAALFDEIRVCIIEMKKKEKRSVIASRNPCAGVLPPRFWCPVRERHRGLRRHAPHGGGP